MAQEQRTGAELIQSVRECANEESPNPTTAFVTDVEILRRIVEAQYTLYDLMLKADPYLFMAEHNFTLTSASNKLALSAVADPGFYRMLGLDYLQGGDPPIKVNRYTFAERNRYSGANFAGNYRLYYTPRIAELTSGGLLDVFTDNYQKYLIASAAAMIMAKAEESDPSSMIAERQFEEARILGSIAARIQEPQQIPLGNQYCGDDDWGYSDLRAWDLQGPSLVIR